MFQITAATCRSFTFGEVLIMAAMNLESDRLNSAARASSLATTSKYARHVVRIGAQKAPLL